MTKLNWSNLTKDERRRYMQLQMSPPGGYDRTGYLPENCGECGACGQAIQGCGWCHDCFTEWKNLRTKLEAEHDK